MKIVQKPDAKQFKKLLTTLQNESWLGHERNWWPKYLFHFANLENAVVSLDSVGRIISKNGG